VLLQRSLVAEKENSRTSVVDFRGDLCDLNYGFIDWWVSA